MHLYRKEVGAINEMRLNIELFYGALHFIVEMRMARGLQLFESKVLNRE
jgi:hypothetical protein